MATALLGADWKAPLRAFVAAAGADGATLVRDDPTDRSASPSRSVCLISTESIAPIVARYIDGGAPPDPRLSRVSPQLTEGFVADLHQFTAAEIASDPFYEEFLRSEGLRWHGCARLAGGEAQPQVYLSLKRAADRSHYARAELAALDRVLPKLRAAAVTAEAVFEAEARERGRLLTESREAVYEVDARGRPVRMNAAAEALAGVGLAVSGRRLTAPNTADQKALDAALSAALAHPPQPGCAVIFAGRGGGRLIVRTLPTVGGAREVFRGVAALALVTRLVFPNAPPERLVADFRMTFGLTAAEARVAALVGLGLSPAEAARKLALAPGTARNYLKACFDKTGTARQAELAALVGAMTR